MRLILHTAAYWLMWTLREAIPVISALCAAEFATLRARLIKIAARVVETASRVGIAFASDCPDAAIFSSKRHELFGLAASAKIAKMADIGENRIAWALAFTPQRSRRCSR